MKWFLAGFGLISLLGCTPTRLTSPTVDSAAVSTDTTARLYATLTASVPSPTPTIQVSTVARVASASPTRVLPTRTASPRAPTATRNASPTPSEITAIATVNLIVREGPGTQYKQSGSLKKGERVVIKAISQDGYWLQHTKGWSGRAYLEVSGDLSQLKPVQVAAPPTTRATLRPTTRAPTQTRIVQVPPTQPFLGIRIGAVCRDGTTSTATGSGACSRHGGVSRWLYR